MGSRVEMMNAPADPGTDSTTTPTVDPFGTEGLLLALRELDPSAALEPREGPVRFCSTERCLCAWHAVLHGHRIHIGHGSPDTLDPGKVSARLATTSCSCCKRERAQAKHQANEKRTCYTCKGTGHLVRDCPQSCCNYCGGRGHLVRDCTFGGSLVRAQQFLTCAPECFVRRFIVPLHRARTGFALDDLRSGRVDVAARLICASLVSSQRLRHNSEIWLPFLGDEEPSTICVTGGLVRGLHPSESSIAARIRMAIDHFGSKVHSTAAAEPRGAPTPTPTEQSGDTKPGTAQPSTAAPHGREESDPGARIPQGAESTGIPQGAESTGIPQGAESTGRYIDLDRELRGFRMMKGGFEAALAKALELSRADNPSAPLLLLVQAPPCSAARQRKRQRLCDPSATPLQPLCDPSATPLQPLCNPSATRLQPVCNPSATPLHPLCTPSAPPLHPL